MKTHTFKTLVFKEGENKGNFAIITQTGFVPTTTPVLFSTLYVEGDFMRVWGDFDIDFSQVELKTVEVTIK